MKVKIGQRLSELLEVLSSLSDEQLEAGKHKLLNYDAIAKENKSLQAELADTKAKAEKLVDALRFYADGAGSYETRSGTNDYNTIVDDDLSPDWDGVSSGGKRAREALKEWEA